MHVYLNAFANTTCKCKWKFERNFQISEGISIPRAKFQNQFNYNYLFAWGIDVPSIPLFSTSNYK